MKFRDLPPQVYGSGARRRSGAALKFVVPALLLALLLALIEPFRTPLGSTLWRATAYLENNGGGVGGAVHAVVAQFSSKAGLAEQNALLEQKLAMLEARDADRDTLYQENIALKAQFGRVDAARSGILAAIIARPPAVPYDTLVIDIGENLEISRGDFVSAGGGTLIGQITDVYATTARVTLFSSAGNTYQGLLRGTIPVTVEGEGAGALSAKIPAGIPVSVGDPIRFPDIAANVSEVVAHIDAPQNDSTKTLYLRLPANVFTLPFVEILPSYGAARQ